MHQVPEIEPHRDENLIPEISTGIPTDTMQVQTWRKLRLVKENEKFFGYVLGSFEFLTHYNSNSASGQLCSRDITWKFEFLELSTIKNI